MTSLCTNAVSFQWFSLISTTELTRDDRYWTARENSSELIEL